MRGVERSGRLPTSSRDLTAGGFCDFSGLLSAVGVLAIAAFMVFGAHGARGADREADPAWRVLFDGHGTDAWRGWVSGIVPAGWHVVDGALTKNGQVEDLLSREEYRNFELDVEWKIGKAGNSGLFYRATRQYEHIYWSAPEYQLLDDANAPDGRSRLTAAGAAYGLYPAPAGMVKPFGEWNSSRLIVNGSHVEHWLNGHKMVSYDLGSAEWKAKVAASKFAAYPDYGRSKRGYIGIQGDHPGMLALRFIRIRVLPDPGAP